MPISTQKLARMDFVEFARIVLQAVDDYASKVGWKTLNYDTRKTNAARRVAQVSKAKTPIRMLMDLLERSTSSDVKSYRYCLCHRIAQYCGQADELSSEDTIGEVEDALNRLREEGKLMEESSDGSKFVHGVAALGETRFGSEPIGFTNFIRNTKMLWVELLHQFESFCIYDFISNDEIVDNKGNGLLHYAVKADQVPTAKYFVSFGLSPTKANLSGEAPFFGVLNDNKEMLAILGAERVRELRPLGERSNREGGAARPDGGSSPSASFGHA